MVEKSGKAELLEKTKDLRALIESKNALMIKDIDEFADSFLITISKKYEETFIRAKREAKNDLEKSTENQPVKLDTNKPLKNSNETLNVKIEANTNEKKPEKSHPIKSETRKTLVNNMESNQDEVDFKFHSKQTPNERSVGLNTASLLKIVTCLII